MPSFKINQEMNNYNIIVNKFVLDDNSLSFSAKGLFCFIFSRSSKSNFTYLDILSYSTDDYVTVKESINELVNSGYIIISNSIIT